MNFQHLMEEAKDIATQLLKIGPTNVVGIDIGLSAVRVAEVSKGKKGDVKLLKFGHFPVPEGSLLEDEIIKPDEILKAITEALRLANINNKNVCIGMSGQHTISKRITVAGGSDSEVNDQVMWESEQYIPFGIDDSTVSFHIIGENEGGGVDVLIAAAKNDVVENFHKIIREVQLKLKVVDLDLFALANIAEAVLNNNKEYNDGSILLVDIGAQSTNMVICKNEAVIFTREMNMGGIQVTEEIQRQMSLSYNEAEELKIRGDAEGNLPEEIVEIINISLETFAAEIKKTINFFMQASAESNIDHCYITGGSSLLPGFLELLEGVLGSPVSFLNPFEKITYNEKNFDETTLSYIASQGVIAIGLAMREISYD